jgi:hypothetical protein
MDRIVFVGLAERHLEFLVVEAVTAVCEAVGPGDERGAMSPVADGSAGIRVQNWSVSHDVLPHATAYFDDRRALVAASDLKLLARRWDRHGSPPC